jgi:hypothetical protein
MSPTAYECSSEQGVHARRKEQTLRSAAPCRCSGAVGHRHDGLPNFSLRYAAVRGNRGPALIHRYFFLTERGLPQR